MFESLQGRLQQIVQRLAGRGVLSETDVDAALREVRLALLEADVNFKVATAFVDQQAGVLVFSLPGATDPVAVATAAVGEARRTGHDVVIIDSAGRQHIDDELMAELVTMREATSPHQVLLVLDAMTGQEAVNIAQRFNGLLRIDGLIVTKMDGDARGGAVLSVVEVTGRPVLFSGGGEKLDGLEPFHPY